MPEINPLFSAVKNDEESILIPATMKEIEYILSANADRSNSSSSL